MNMKPQKIIFRWLAVLGLGAALAFQTGCVVVAAGAAGAGVVAYVRGELETTLEGRLDGVHQGTNRAVTQLEFSKISDQKDALSAKVVARTAQDKKIEIVLTKVGDKLTKVQIRVGIFGDEEMSRTILDKIKASL
jgi:hypothetical protein